ncbi:MAG: hypothetical protein JWM34_2421 [Ilumatobacteraceae bacterium]|nr:hypothetical protein [Ilumatobacteraceae bacterium]
MSVSSPTIDITSEAFALRLANLLRATRLEHGLSFRALARMSEGRFTREQIREFEEGTITLDEELVDAIAGLYAADLGTILPSRLPVSINAGVISAGGVDASFAAKNATSLLTAYLRLIRTMRRQKKAPMIALRREDIEVLAEYLDESGETIVDRLTALMGATLTQRTAMATMFATGAIIIGLAGSTAARAPDTSATAAPRAAGSRPAVVVTTTTPALANDAVDTTVPVTPSAATASSETATTETATTDVATSDVPATEAATPVVTPATDAVTPSTTAHPAATHPATTPTTATTSAPDDAATPTTVDAAAAATTVVADDAPPTTDDLSWLDGDGTTQIPTSANVPVDDTVPDTTADGSTTNADDTPPVPTDSSTTVTTPVTDTTVPAGDVATDTPPVPSYGGSTQTLMASDAPVPTEAVGFVAESAVRMQAGQDGPVQSRRAAQQEKQQRRAERKNAVAVRRIQSRADAAIERTTNRIYAEADDERVAALQVVYARADAAIARAAERIYLNGRNAKSDAVMASVREEVLARAADDKDAVLDRIYTRADADRNAAVTTIRNQAQQALEGLGLV